MPTLRERAVAALEGKPPLPGLVPSAELEFQLTQEKFGQKYHIRQEYEAAGERDWLRLAKEDAALYVRVCRHYDLSFMNLNWHPGTRDHDAALRDYIAIIHDLAPGELLIIVHGDATLSLPDGTHMNELVFRMTDDRENFLRELGESVDRALESCARAVEAGVDGFALCADYCYNSGPWCSPAMFADFVTPFLTRLTQGQRALGAYVIKHTDGNIMPILDQLVASGPHALHSLDPQAKVDIREVKRICGDRLCLIGNVNCGLLQTGTREEMAENVRYALRWGMPGGRFILALSNVAFKGMPLESYELVQRLRHEEGIYA